MSPLSIDQIRRATEATVLSGNVPRQIDAICTDTRAMKPASLFIALRGENFDAHNFLAEAAAKGAVAALVDRNIVNAPDGMCLLRVDDTRRAMGRLARHVRLRLKSKVIAVAGSNGKTSTKHLIDSALRQDLRGSFSPRSYNNDIGVPLAIFPAAPNDDYLVLELGTNHPGEIRSLTHIAVADIAVITNCGPEHLEFLRDLDGVRRENGSIIEGLKPNGTLIINGDDAELRKVVAPYTGQILTFGFGRHNDLFAVNIRCGDDGVRFNLGGENGREVFVPLLGEHTASNALAAIAVARQMGLSDDRIVAALAEAHGPEMRLQLQRSGEVTILNDAYNANPASMKAALKTMQTLRGRRRVAVLGDMRELGELADGFHREIGRIASECGVDVLICVGEKGALIAEEARQGGTVRDIRHFLASEAAAAEVRGYIRDGDLVLLKGSRGVHLERVADAIKRGREPFPAGTPG